MSLLFSAKILVPHDLTEPPANGADDAVPAIENIPNALMAEYYIQ